MVCTASAIWDCVCSPALTLQRTNRVPRSLTSSPRRMVDQLVEGGTGGAKGSDGGIMMKVVVFMNCPGSCALFKGMQYQPKMKEGKKRKE
ncbi:hypothetical protein V9T40_001284 [Parthenolecanium corni]|uniref:Uncharacterized protein n=1 Tax=Parthenolecanium corni TaxID=536013 RepID=A0AAN9TD82_9HEMI